MARITAILFVAAWRRFPVTVMEKQKTKGPAFPPDLLSPTTQPTLPNPTKSLPPRQHDYRLSEAVNKLGVSLPRDGLASGLTEAELPGAGGLEIAGSCRIAGFIPGEGQRAGLDLIDGENRFANILGRAAFVHDADELLGV